jgi:hypothetical protein
MQKRIIAIVLLVITAASAAHAQQTATTADGKKVVLNTDGTWKYADAPSGVTLRIETGLVYRNGDVKPVARSPFALLALDPRPELMRLPPAGELKLDGLGQLGQKCWRDSYPEAPAIIRKHTRYTFTTGFDGKGEIRDIAPGKYWLFGQALGGNICLMWIMEVDLTKDQSLTIDQNNAIN